jgi:jumonji domain-containing protein 7
MRAGAGSDDRAPGRSPCGAGSEDRSKLRRVLSKVTRDYWVGNEVEVLEYPTAIEFMRRAVCAYRPVIIRGLMDDWRAMEYWDLENMNELMKDAEISVNLTPDGLADAVKSVPTDNGNEKRVFTYPYECTMPFSTFYRMMEEPEEDDAVPYLSEQNDNLRQKFQQVVNDVPSSLPLVDEVFGNPETEAINLWIGDERSVTSLHKDHFEVSSVVSCYCLCFTTAIPILFVQNFYCVVCGEKTFTLFPPTDTAFIPEEKFESCGYSLTVGSSSERNHGHMKKSDLVLNNNNNSTEASTCGSSSDSAANTTNNCGSGCAGGVESDGSSSGMISWIPIDPDDEYSSIVDRYPQFVHANPLRCTLYRGDVLYIPAMWYHRVSQNCLTIAVNYWVEQSFDFRWVVCH